MSNCDNDSEESVLGNLHAPMVLKEEDLRGSRDGYLGEGIPSKKRESSQQPGKELCKILRRIRVEIARNNGIPFWSEECQFDGPCKGTCPKCDAEIRYLTEELEKKKAKGEQVVLTPQENPDLDRINRRPADSGVDCDSDCDSDFDCDSDQLVGEIWEEPLDEDTDLDFGDDDPDDFFGLEMGKVGAGGKGDWTIDCLELSIRTYNCLKRSGINTLDELLQYSPSKLAKIRTLGRRSHEEIIMKLQELGLELPPDE